MGSNHVPVNQNLTLSFQLFSFDLPGNIRKPSHFLKKILQRIIFVSLWNLHSFLIFPGESKGSNGKERVTFRNVHKIYRLQNFCTPTSDSLLFELWTIDSNYPLSLQRCRTPIMDHAHPPWMHQYSRNILKLV